MNYRITNVDVLTLDEDWGFLPRSEVGISAGKIAYLGAAAREETASSVHWTEIDGSGMVCMPGMINTHNHAAMSLLRGYADDMLLEPWLNERIWPVEARMQPEDIYWGTLLSVAEMLKGGTTCFADMYFHMDQVARACEQAGIRAVLARGLIGGRGERQDDATLEEGLSFALKYQSAAGGRIRTMLGPHAPYTCPEPFLRRVVSQSEQYDLGLHIHLSETEGEVRNIREKYGLSPIRWAKSIGVLDRPLLAAHCVHVDEEEIEMLAAVKGGVAHDPVSNLKLASGIAPVSEMLAAGVNVSIGTDGPASANHLGMFKELRTAALLQKNRTGDPRVSPARQALQMATRNGARAVGQPELGRLYPGGPADCVLIDLHKPHLTPFHDPESTLCYSAQESDVAMVWVAGELVVREGRCLLIDEAEVLQMAQSCAERITASR